MVNYQDVFDDELFWRAFWNTATYSVWSIPLSMAIGLGLALLLNQKLRGLGIYRTIYYVPVVTSMVAVAMIWVQLFDPLYGVISNTLDSIGIKGIDWLGDPALAMPSVSRPSPQPSSSTRRSLKSASRRSAAMWAPSGSSSSVSTGSYVRGL